MSVLSPQRKVRDKKEADRTVEMRKKLLSKTRLRDHHYLIYYFTRAKKIMADLANDIRATSGSDNAATASRVSLEAAVDSHGDYCGTRSADDLASSRHGSCKIDPAALDVPSDTYSDRDKWHGISIAIFA